jgi:hypothetical protein
MFVRAANLSPGGAAVLGLTTSMLLIGVVLVVGVAAGGDPSLAKLMRSSSPSGGLADVREEASKYSQPAMVR